MILEACILTLLLTYLSVPLSFKHRITQVFLTDMEYSWWEEARKAWGTNTDRYRDLIKMATVWSAPRQENDEEIANMEPWWAGEKVKAEA